MHQTTQCVGSWKNTLEVFGVPDLHSQRRIYNDYKRICLWKESKLWFNFRTHSTNVNQLTLNSINRFGFINLFSEPHQIILFGLYNKSCKKYFSLCGSLEQYKRTDVQIIHIERESI